MAQAKSKAAGADKAETTESKPRESRLERLQRELAEEQVKEAERLVKVRADRVERRERAIANIDKWNAIKAKLDAEIERIDTVVNNSTAVDYALAVGPAEAGVEAKLEGIAGTREEFSDTLADEDDDVA